MSKATLTRTRQSGRTLIELMIAISLGLLILGAMLIVYLTTSSTSRQSTAVTRMNEDAAIALHYIGSSLRMAAFSFPRVNAPANAAMADGVKVTATERNFQGAGIRGCDNGFVAQSTTAFDALTCATTPGSAAFAVRFEGDIRNTSPSGTNATDCQNRAVTGVTASDLDPSVNYTLIESRFFLQTSSASGTSELYCSGNGTGTMGTGAFSAQPLMQYVERMTVEYGIAEDALGRDVVRYVSAAAVDGLAGSVNDRWKRVVNVKVCIQMRSESPDQAGTGQYLDCAGAAQSSAGGLLRRAYSTVFTLRNRSGMAVGGA